MNTDNYASLEASKRLVDAGIMLETDCVWRKKRDKTGYYLSRKALYHRTTDIPAPCMAEVWRELPDGIVVNGSYADLYITKREEDRNEYNGTICGYSIEYHMIFSTRADNPTDALIDLLIWVRKEDTK